MCFPGGTPEMVYAPDSSVTAYALVASTCTHARIHGWTSQVMRSTPGSLSGLGMTWFGTGIA